MPNFFRNQIQAILNSFEHISRYPFRSIILCLIISMLLTFPAMLCVLLKNIMPITQTLTQTTEFSVYLKNNTTAQQALRLEAILRENPDIARVKLISPDQGIKEVQEAGLYNIIVKLPENPLPWTLEVLPRNIEIIEPLTKTLKQYPEVDQLQIDLTWIKRLPILTTFIHRSIVTLLLLIGSATILTIAFTIHLTIRQLVTQHKPLGRRAFLYTGLLYGLLAGIIASQWIDFLLMWVNNALNDLAQNYHYVVKVVGFNTCEVLYLVAASMALGLASAWLSKKEISTLN